MAVVAEGMLLVPFHATLCTPCGDASGFRWPPIPDPRGTTESMPSEPSGGSGVTYMVFPCQHRHRWLSATFREQHPWDKASP